VWYFIIYNYFITIIWYIGLNNTRFNVWSTKKNSDKNLSKPQTKVQYLIKIKKTEKSFVIVGLPAHSPVAVVELTIWWIRINTTSPIHLNTIWWLEFTRETGEICYDTGETHILDPCSRNEKLYVTINNRCWISFFLRNNMHRCTPYIVSDNRKVFQRMKPRRPYRTICWARSNATALGEGVTRTLWECKPY